MTGGEALVAVARELAAWGLSPGTSGNVSVRAGDTMLMTPTGASLASARADGLVTVRLDDGSATGGTPSKEVPLHRGFYSRDPSFGAVVHLHSPYAMAASCLAPWSEHSAVPPISPYFLMRVGQTPLLPYFRPGDPALGSALAAVPFDCRAALLQNHGQIVAAPTVEEARDMAVELEEACRLVVLVGDRNPALVEPDEALELAGRFGVPWSDARLRK
ncbi:class II aldolase/adducin family protein [Nakamurella endophytica]|uniref:Class II aldolase n=1 Tax=Nakamurella endophytica TaxID=1748367 RepID=A0A917WE86_9ACTN|nr:class II aldolase/adducin family protein [Nakamurella endophytica]GGL94611.1 class II aldolase [Nakamurella endophytica]